MKFRGIRSLIASVSSVLVIGLIVSLGTQPSELAAVPMASDGQPEPAYGVSTAAPNLPSPPADAVALVARSEAAQGAAPATSAVPEEAPGEDTTVLTVPSVVPTVPIPQVIAATAEPGTGTLLSMPLKGRKTSRFGMRFHPIRHVWKLHSGLDLAAPCGTPVGAAAAGTVTKAGWAGGNGIQVKVDHGTISGQRVVTTYNHLSAIGVSVGQKVVAHQGVGRVGNTGFSTGCHLHFEVIANGKFTNPEPWLNGSSVAVDTAAMVAGRPGVPGSSLPLAPKSTTLPASLLPSATPTSSASPTPTASATATASTSPTAPPASPTPSATATPSASAGASASASPTPCVTPSLNPDGTPVENLPCESVTPSTSPSAEESSTPPDSEDEPSTTPTQTEPVTAESPTANATPTMPTSIPSGEDGTPSATTSAPVTTTSTPPATTTTTAAPSTTTATTATTTKASTTPTTEQPPTVTQTATTEAESTPEA